MQESNPSSFQVVRSREALASEDRQIDEAHVFVIEESMGYLVNYLGKLFAQIQAIGVAAHGVTLGQWGVLLFLWVQDGLTQRELSHQVLIDDASMVRAIDRMERDGLVRRIRNEHDRRQMNIFLTEKGRALRDQLIPHAVTGNAVAMQGFTEAEHQQVFALLHRMIASLEGALSTGPTRIHR